MWSSPLKVVVRPYVISIVDVVRGSGVRHRLFRTGGFKGVDQVAVACNVIQAVKSLGTLLRRLISIVPILGSLLVCSKALIGVAVAGDEVKRVW